MFIARRIKRPARENRHRSQGFALLEALVAIVVVAAVGSALFALISSGLQNLQRAERHIALTSLQPSVIAWVRSLPVEELSERYNADLALEYEGTTYTAEAELELFHGPTRVVSTSGAEGIHDAALYNVTVTLYEHDRSLGQIQLRKVGSRQVIDAPQF